MSTEAQEPGTRALWKHMVVLFGITLALKWPTLFDPPVWDAAMGLFPPALTLAENGFDLVALLGMPNYDAGGPNGHSASLVTLLTAVVLLATGGGTPAFVVLHVVHCAVAAWALALLYRYAQPVLGNDVSGLLCGAVLLHPVFNAQVGYLYMEIPLFLCAVGALTAWMDRRVALAVVWATLGYAIKETGIVAVGTLAVAAVLERSSIREKIRQVGWILLPPIFWTAGVTFLRRLGTEGADVGVVPELGSIFGGTAQYLDRFLFNVPDLIAFFVVFAAAFLATLPATFAALRREPGAPAGGQNADRASTRPTSPRADRPRLVLALSGVFVVLFVLLFAVALPVLAGFTVVLPRYYVLVLPFLLLWTGYGVGRLAGAFPRTPRARGAPEVGDAPVGGRRSWATGTCYVILSLLFFANSGGALYPPDVDTEGPGNDQPLTERSNAYRRLASLQRQAMAALEDLPRDVPVYYGRYEHYLLHYPGLGYATGPLDNGHDLSLGSLADIVRSDPFPPCVYALYNYPWLGGRKILGLIRFAETTPALTTDIVEEFRDGPYVITLARVRRVDTDCAP